MDPRERLAQVAVDAAVGITEGAMLRIRAEHPNRELLYAISRLAYQRGARLVRIDYTDPRLTRIRVDHSLDQHVDAISAMAEMESQLFVDEGWSHLYLEGYEDATVLEGADASRLTRMQRTRGKATTPLRRAQLASKVAWSVLPAATDGWARTVLGEGATAADLWRVLVPILRLDTADPAAELLSHMMGLERRAAQLTARGLRTLRFQAPGTDLRVSVAPESIWMGGPDRLPSGALFMPNIPTEEIFTTPDWRGTEGVVTTTRPFRIHGSRVDGARLVFRGGVVVESAAKQGAEVLTRFLETDEGSRRLGEVALVDCTSPIWKSGHIFDSMLLDENAACHIALGGSYDPAFRGAAAWTEEEKPGHGVNVSVVHEDMMVGSESLDLTATDAAGREVPLIRAGRFVV